MSIQEPPGHGTSIRQAASWQSRECQWEQSRRPGERLHRCHDLAGTLIFPNCDRCPFRQPDAMRTQVTGPNGEIIAETEWEYLWNNLKLELERAQTAMARLNDLIISMEKLWKTRKS